MAKSATTGSPAISFPKAKVSGERACTKGSEVMISRSAITWRCKLGISIPTVDLPGITSTTRTDGTDNARAKSLARLLIWDTLTPGAGNTSNRVTTGPGCTDSTEAFTPKSRKFCSKSWDISANCSGE